MRKYSMFTVQKILFSRRTQRLAFPRAPPLIHAACLRGSERGERLAPSPARRHPE